MDAEAQIEQAIKKEYRDAEITSIQRLGDQFMGGYAYYIEFKSKELEADESYYYSFVDKDGCKLYDDGVEVIHGLQQTLEKRRSFMQRIREFEFPDIIGAIIAILITITFVVLVVIGHGTEGAVSKEFLAIFAIIVGYYFGKIKPGAS